MISKEELPELEREHAVISTKLLAGRPVVHVYSDTAPGPGFEPSEPDLDYLGGRFLAAFALNALILLAVPAGILPAVHSLEVQAGIDLKTDDNTQKIKVQS